MAATAAPGYASAETEAVLKRLQRFAYWMDDCIPIPGTDIRVGLDPLVGLIPVWGDAASAVVACYVPYEAIRAGAPPSLVFKMLFYIVAEAALGAVPIFGDIADALLKTNEINVEMLADYLRG